MTFIIMSFVVVQVVIFLVVVYFLKKALHQNLINMAIHQFEVMFAHQLDPAINKIEVMCFSQLPSGVKERIQQAVIKKFKKPVEVVFSMDKLIKGGMIIRVGKTTIDASLASRLKESGWAK